MLAGVFNMLGYLDEGLGDLDDSLLIQLIVVASGHDNNLSCFQVLTPKNKT